MDGLDITIKKEQSDFDIEDKNENYLQLDFEIGVKVENNSPDIEDWCLENARHYQGNIVYEDVKDEFEVYTCSICHCLFTDRHTLYKHNLMHLRVVLDHPKRLYQCDYCQCYVTNRLKMKEHIHTKHYMKLRNTNAPITKSLQKCLICDKTMPYKKWHGHMRTVHGTDRHKCKECHLDFKCERYLRRHILYIHRGLKPSWRFHKVPIRIAEFKCDLCPKRFTNRSSYRVHLRNCHTDSYECKLCHSILKCKSYLDTHMKRVHYDDGNVHKCDICCKEFKSPRYLNVHKKNSHLVKIKKINTKMSRVEVEVLET